MDCNASDAQLHSRDLDNIKVKLTQAKNTRSTNEMSRTKDHGRRHSQYILSSIQKTT